MLYEAVGVKGVLDGFSTACLLGCAVFTALLLRSLGPRERVPREALVGGAVSGSGGAGQHRTVRRAGEPSSDRTRAGAP